MNAQTEIEANPDTWLGQAEINLQRAIEFALNEMEPEEVLKAVEQELSRQNQEVKHNA